tara:strand:- start:290 stop:523 length:234 start_codon:yes stop_codon:yes gene_type:complete
MVNWNEHIVSDPKILFGKPVIKGTRIPVDLILEKLANGETFESLLTDYPKLTKEKLYACLAFASKLTNMSQSFEISA